MNTCECGRRLDYHVSPYIMREKRVCPNCGRIHWVDDRPIDWERINKESKEQ